MLVLTRKKSEQIRIGNDIVVSILKTGRSTVKIGIDAPRAVQVLKEEMVDPEETLNQVTIDGFEHDPATRKTRVSSWQHRLGEKEASGRNNHCRGEHHV